MTHSQIRAQLSEYLERDLGNEQRAQIGAHLESCADCERELRELRATVSLLRGLPEPELPSGIGETVMARIARGEGRESRVYSLFRRAAEPRFAAPLAAGLAGFFILFQSGDSGLSPRPTPESGPANHMELSTLSTLATLADDRGDAHVAWRDTADDGQGHWAGVVSRRTPAVAFQQYVSRARMEAARRLTQSREYARQLRGAGHPNSASLASHFESRPTVVLAEFRPR